MPETTIGREGGGGKWTPGPWEAVAWPTSYTDEVPDWCPVALIGGPEDFTVAVFIGDAPGMNASANATLAAAAPAMAEALRALLWLKDGPRDDAYRAAKDQAWEEARAALALAQGDEG